MKGFPLDEAGEGEYEVLAVHWEGGKVHLLMRQPTSPGSNIYYYAFRRGEVSYQSDDGVGVKSVLVARKIDGEMAYTIHHQPF